MRLYMIRHGQSVANVGDRKREPVSSIGVGDALSDEGWEQAQALGRRLASENITRILTSPLQRAQESAVAISDEIDVPVEILDIAHETIQDDSFYEAADVDRGTFYSVNWMPDHATDYRLGTAESFHDLQARMGAVLEYLENLSDEQILMVVHANFLRFFLGTVVLSDSFTPREFHRFWRHIDTTNTGISIFENSPKRIDGIDLSGWRLVTWMDHAHL